MTRSIRIALALAASLLHTTSARAGDGEWRVSTGRAKVAEGTWIPFVVKPDGVAVLQRAIADELAQAQVTRDWASAAAKLDTWGATCTWAGGPDREKLLEHVALRKVELYERFGRTREALAAVEGVLVPPDWTPTDGLELKDATAEDLAMQARVLATPQVAANRERLRAVVAAPAVADDEIRRIVSEAVSKRDGTQLAQLGKRAVPALRDIAAGDADVWEPEEEDALTYLTKLDERVAADVILEQFDRGGAFWRRKALRAMRGQHVLKNPGTWVPDSERPDDPRLAEPFWRPVVLRLLREPDVAAEAVALAGDIAAGDALDEPLIAALLELLRSGDREIVDVIEKMLGAWGGRHGVHRILVAMLDSADAEQRAFAANELANYLEDPALRARIGSPDRTVRAAVVRSLDLRQVYRRWFGQPEGFPSLVSRQSRDPRTASPDDVRLLELGLRDADAEIRVDAAKILQERRIAVSDATWDVVAADADPRVRASAARAVWVATPETAARVLGVLAKDVDPEVVARVDETLLSLLSSTANVDLLIPAVLARRANDRATPLARSPNAPVLYERLVATSAGAAIVGDWAEAGEEAAQVKALEYVRQKLFAAKRTTELRAAGIPYDDRRLARLFAATSTWSSGGQPAADLWDRIRIADRAPWRELALDSRQPLSLRLPAFALAFEPGDEALVGELGRALSSGDDSAARSHERSLSFLMERLDEAAAGRVLDAVLAVRAAPVLTGDLVTAFVRTHDLDAAQAHAILAVHLAEGDDKPWWSRDGVIAALRQVAAVPLAAQGDWFARAIRRRSFAQPTVQILGELREPAYRALLVECLDAGWMAEVDERKNVRTAAIVAIGRYLDDEAVEILLGAAERFNGTDLGAACYDALQRIQVHREQRAAWEQRKRAGASKDAAIGELVKLLASSDAAQRAQAVRSLATLGAVEELPRVVALLKDSDAAVRAAAASALEVLNASTAKPR